VKEMEKTHGVDFLKLKFFCCFGEKIDQKRRSEVREVMDQR
jgi:hypothetical protein